MALRSVFCMLSNADINWYNAIRNFLMVLYQLMSALLNMQNTVRSAIGVPPTVAGAQGLTPEMNVSTLIINPSKS